MVTGLLVVLPYMTVMFWYTVTHDILGAGGYVLAFVIGFGCNATIAVATRIASLRADL